MKLVRSPIVIVKFGFWAVNPKTSSGFGSFGYLPDSNASFLR